MVKVKSGSETISLSRKINGKKFNLILPRQTRFSIFNQRTSQSKERTISYC